MPCGIPKVTAMMSTHSVQADRERGALIFGSSSHAPAGSLLFIALFCCVLACPCAFFILQHIPGVALPDRVTSESAQVLSGATEDPALSVHASLTGFRSGAFQEALGAEIEDNIPFKADILMGEAALQRGFIAASNALFDWQCYPTFYGSEELYLPSLDALTSIPEDTVSEYDWAGWEDFVRGAVAFAKAHPDKRVTVWVEGTNSFYDGVMDEGLMSDVLTKDMLVADAMSIAGEVPNVRFLSKSEPDIEGYYERNYRSDHHWNAEGAQQAYEIMVNALGLESQGEVPFGSVSALPFDGWRSRDGLMKLEEPVTDALTDYSELTLWNADGTEESGQEHRKYFDSDEDEQRYYFYEDYYGAYGSTALLEGARAKNALMISDSFGAAVKRPLATNYGKLYTEWCLTGGEISQGLESYCADKQLDDIYFVGKPANYADMMERNPGLFTS